MKSALLVLTMISLVSCSSGVTPGTFKELPQFDWMPNDLLWQHNLRDCRSQPQCNPADLFDRTA